VVRRLRVLAAIAAALFAGAAETDRAWATHCYWQPHVDGPKNHIYQFGNPNTRGTTNKILFRDRTTGSCVGSHISEGTNRSYAWSAAHVRLGFTTNDNSLSVGWHKYFASGERIRAYTQWIRETQTTVHCCFDPSPTCMNHNEEDQWRVSFSTGTYWGLYINCIDGSGYRHLISYGETGHTLGTALGETGRYADTEVHMADEQTNLLFRTQQTPPTWVLWNDNRCWKDDAAQWRSWKITAHGYRVDWGTDTDCVD
jgi:hypothetical protein